MFCPNCRTEYREGFTECSDCGATLVEKLPDLPPKVPEPQSDLVTVFESYNLPNVVIAKSILDDANIDYLVKDELAEAYFVIGPIEIQVTPEHAEEAHKLLEGLDEGGLVKGNSDLDDSAEEAPDSEENPRSDY